MAKKIKDLSVVTGTYTNSNGEEKRCYMNCGALMQSDDGNQFIMLNRFINYASLPRKQGSESLLISIFDLKDQPKEQQANNSAYVSSDLDDDVPF